jgi:hypothetical protein
MLDYDKACGRDTPSVACIVDPFTGTSRQAAFWGTTPHYLPSKFETLPNEVFLDRFLKRNNLILDVLDFSYML